MMSSSLQLTDNAPHELVKVVARVRPLSTSETSNESTIIVETDPERNEILVAKLPDPNSSPMLSSSLKTEYRPFTFDAVFDNSFSQSQIYDKVFRTLVNSVMEGFNGTIFAYGQTGTGKTFTMEGSLDCEMNYGVMPNAFKHIFDQITAHREKRYLIGVSYFEIYQEEIIDLIDHDVVKKCVIHESPNGGIHIKGLSSYLCSSFTEISQLLKKGKKNRAVGSTNMNEHSSRSHAIFQVTIETSDQFDVEGEHIKVGKLNLVDLAGSERVSKTGAEGQRLKEASKINLSLSSLGNVISALVDGARFIPYRDSKLTRILQDSLGGNSRTIMVATVGPASYNYEETVNTLRYATRAKSIQNKPRLNENPKDAVLRKYQDEINRLRKMVEEQKARKNSATSSKPTTAISTTAISEDDDDGSLKKIKLKTSKSQSSLINANNSSHHHHQGMIQMMEMSRINELREMLEPLGIYFEGDIEETRAKLREKTECLEKDTEILKAGRDEMSAALKKATRRLQSVEDACSTLMTQIKWLESKVLNSSGENELLQKTKSQEEEIEEKAKELESHKMRHEQLRKVLAEKEMTNEEAYANANALENDYRVNLEKLNKVTRKITKFESVCTALKKKHGDDVISLKSCIEEMSKELKLKKTIVDNFVPKKIRKDIDQRMRYDSTKDEYFVENPSERNTLRCHPKVDNSLRFPLFNFTRFSNLQPMENTFFTNENVLLLGPNIPTWPAVKFVADIANPRVESLVKSALKDINNAMIINCDHKGNKFRIGQNNNDAPSYVAVGPTILLRNVRSDKYVDFSAVPSDVNLPNGANICPLQTPHRSLNGAKFTPQQLLAFPLIKYTIMGELSFEDFGQQKHNVVPPSPQKKRRAEIHSPSTQQLQFCGDGRKLQNKQNLIQTGYGHSNIASPPILSPPSCRPKTSSRPVTARSSSFSLTDNSSLVDNARLRKSVDPYELEQEVNDNEEIMQSDDTTNMEQKTYSNDEERMLQRLHYFASRKEHTTKAKTMAESQEKGHMHHPSRIPTPVLPFKKGGGSSGNKVCEIINESRQQRNFDSQNRPTTARPPSRKHFFDEFSNGDSYIG